MFATFSGPRATQLVLTTPPSGAVAGASFGVQPVGELRDARGIRAVGCAGAVIRAELVSGPGALQGTTLATVDASGAFAFSTLGVTIAGTYSLRFVVVGFAPNATASGLVASGGGSITRGLASAVVRVTTQGVTRSLAGGTFSWPNRSLIEGQSGYTLLVDSGFESDTLSSSLPENATIAGGALTILNTGSDRTAQIVSIGDSSIGESRTFRFAYPANHVSGGGVQAWMFPSPTRRKCYMAGYVRFSSNFEFHPSGIHKLWFTRTNGTTGQGWIEWRRRNDLHPGNPERLVVEFVNQLQGGSGGIEVSSTAAGYFVVPGQWYRVESYYEIGTTNRLRAWLDGVLQFDSSFPADNLPFNELCFSGILGGIGTMTNPAQSMDFDRICVAVAT